MGSKKSELVLLFNKKLCKIGKRNTTLSMTPFLRNTEEATGFLESSLPSFGLVSGHIGSANLTYTTNPHNNVALGMSAANIPLETALRFL